MHLEEHVTDSIVEPVQDRVVLGEHADVREHQDPAGRTRAGRHQLEVLRDAGRVDERAPGRAAHPVRAAVEEGAVARPVPHRHRRRRPARGLVVDPAGGEPERASRRRRQRLRGTELDGRVPQRAVPQQVLGQHGARDRVGRLRRVLRPRRAAALRHHGPRPPDARPDHLAVHARGGQPGRRLDRPHDLRVLLGPEVHRGAARVATAHGPRRPGLAAGGGVRLHRPAPDELSEAARPRAARRDPSDRRRRDRPALPAAAGGRGSSGRHRRLPWARHRAGHRPRPALGRGLDRRAGHLGGLASAVRRAAPGPRSADAGVPDRHPGARSDDPDRLVRVPGTALPRPQPDHPLRRDVDGAAARAALHPGGRRGAVRSTGDRRRHVDAAGPGAAPVGRGRRRPGEGGPDGDAVDGRGPRHGHVRLPCRRRRPSVAAARDDAAGRGCRAVAGQPRRATTDAAGSSTIWIVVGAAVALLVLGAGLVAASKRRRTTSQP